MTRGTISILCKKLRPLLYSGILCHDPTNFTSSAVFLRHNYITLSTSAYVRKQQQPKKHQHKAREISKQHFSSSSSASLSLVLTPNEKPQLSENQAIGTVASSLANFKRVVVNSENSGSLGVELLCVVKGVLKNINTRVLVGDEVLVGAIDWADRRGRIEKVFPRKSEILDPYVANVDHLLLMFSLEQPKIKPYMLTRFLVEAESTGIPLTLVLNKAELIDEATLLEWESRLRSWGYEVVLCSVNTERGLDKLKFILRDQTSVIFGPSGVGKSSLINALRGNKNVLGATEDDNCSKPIVGSKWLKEQRVGEVSAHNGLGKHTTRNVSLLPLSRGGYLADTPGFSQPSLMKVTTQSLTQHFPEIRKILKDGESRKCTLSNCLHIGEPGCLVTGDWERYAYYYKLLREIMEREKEELKTVGTKRKRNLRIKNLGHGVMLTRAEPRLETKKHKRQSRKKVKQSFLEKYDDDVDDDDDFEDKILY